MGRYWAVAAGVATAIIVLFVAVEALGIPILVDPSPWMSKPDPLAAGLGAGLLAVDVLLPVPSSLVMIANGTLFGLVLGAAISFVGAQAGAMIGFALGRRGEAFVTRFATVRGRARADALLERWGVLAIIVTRPIPVLAETMIILAGASTLGWRRAVLATAISNLALAVLYAAVGSGVTRILGT